MTITGSNTTHFNFQKIGSNDDAGYSTIGEVIDSIDTLLDASDRLIADAQSPSVGYTIEWDGSDWVAGQLDTAGIATGAVTSAKILDDTIVNADINSAAAIAYSKLNLASSITSADIVNGTIVNADVNASAAIDKTKISGTAVTVADTGTVTSTMILDDTILNADVNSSAAISYSKLNLATSIVNADISASAAIVDTKLATISTASKVSNSATTATDANTASAIVARDASGNFTAGTITAALTGNASTSTTATNLAGGAGGSIPYQSAASTTAMLANGSAGQILTSNGTTLAPTFESISSGSVTLAGDVAGAANANSIGVGAVTSSKIANDTIVDADINSAAAIAYSKLSLGTSIVNADISASAAIAYSKLSLGTSIVNADISASAAIAYSKLNLTNSVTSADIVSVTLNQIPSYESYRNLIINGGMSVAQRSTSIASITGDGYYTADRWFLNSASTYGTFTQSVAADAPTGSGLSKSLKMLCTTANATLDAGDFLAITQRIEGQDLQRIAKGTASAKELSLSFWVKEDSSVGSYPKTYIVNLRDMDNSRSVSASYTISASATWEKKTIVFPADATGVFDNDNLSSLEVYFGLTMGSTYTSGTLNTTWATSTSANRFVGQTNLSATINNYWQVTGIQLETGSVATPFEFEPFETTLRKCQRYYYRTTSPGAGSQFGSGLVDSTTQAFCVINFPVSMRIGPTSLDTTGVPGDYGIRILGSGIVALSAVPAISSVSQPAVTNLTCIVASGLTAGQSCLFRAANASAYLGFAAEL